jgi:ABC-type transport system involved in cytochrome bd biosynthesis fused ATPase/permease subunit
MAMVDCFGRIEEFIQQDQRRDLRQIDATPTPGASSLHNIKDGKPLLKGNEMNLTTRKLTMIISLVGCGKSTLLKGMLKEMPSLSGTVHIALCSVAFCDQTPWVLNNFLKENITMFLEPSDLLYRSVLHACTLNNYLK